MPFPFGGANTLFNFGAQGTSPTNPPTPIMLELARQNAEAQNKIDPRQSQPAYSPWQLAGVIAKGLQGWTGQDTVGQRQALDAQAQASDYAGPATMNGAPTPITQSNANPYQTSASSFTTPSPQAHNEGMNHKDAATRNNNPGAMWPNPIATEFGATGHQDLQDGHGNKIATFPDPVSGAAAQFALLDRNYQGMPIRSALTRWSTNPEYASEIVKKLGVDPRMPLTREFLASPKGIDLTALMAKHEAGHVAPLTMDDWKVAQAKGLGLTNDLVQHGDLANVDKSQMLEQSPAPTMMGLGGKDLVQPASFTPPSREGIGSSPQQATPVAQPQGQQTAQNGQTIPPMYSTVPSKPFTAGELMSLDALPPAMREQFIAGRMRQYQPQVTEGPLGTGYYKEGVGTQFMPKALQTTVSGPHGASEQGYSFFGPQGEATTKMPLDIGGGKEGNAASALGTFGGQAENAYQKQEQLEGQLNGSRNNYSDLKQQLQYLQAQRLALEDPTYIGGPAAPEATLVQKMLAYIPGYEGTATAPELAEKLNAKNILNTISKFSHDAKVGRILMPEVMAVQQTQGRETDTKAGRIAINEIEQRAIKRALGLAQRTIEYADNESSVRHHLDLNWDQAQEQWLNDPNNLSFKPGELDNLRKTLELDKPRVTNPINPNAGSEGNKGPKRLLPSRDNPNKYEYR